MGHFKYSREVEVVKKDEKGNKVPLIVEGVPVEGKFEKEKVIVNDTLNTDEVLRSVAYDEDSILVILKDGHEESQVQPKLKNPKHGPIASNIIENRQRVWVQSEIILKGKDVERFYNSIGV